MRLVVDRGSDQLAVHLHLREEAQTFAVLVPAMGVPAGYYRRFAEALNEAGVSVAVADLRGTGESLPRPGRGSAYGYDELTDDVGAVLDAVEPYRAGLDTLLIGHSLGGQACVTHLARTRRSDVDGLVLIAVGLPYWRSYGRISLPTLFFTQLIAGTAAVLGVWPGWGFGGRQARKVITDWGYTARRGAFPPALRVEESLAQVTTPVLAISVDHDQYTPPATTDHLVGKLTSAPVSREHLTEPDAQTKLDHFMWVKAGPVLAQRVLGWAKQLPRP